MFCHDIVSNGTETPFNVVVIWDEAVTFKTVPFTVAEAVDVLKGFTFGDVIVTTGAAAETAGV